MFKNYYKFNTVVEGQQENRRRIILEEQKRKREQLQDEHRTNELQEDFSVDCDSSRFGTRNFREHYKTDRSLQLSEWMREQPSDLGDWIMVGCPVGQRCLVVACNKRTTVYNKAGRSFYTFRSQLPGSEVGSKNVTILDCIYRKKENTFYVLDTIAFGTQDLMNCEAEFRFFWLKCRFAESEELQAINEHNEKRFILLDHIDLLDESKTRETLLRYPYWPNNSPELDGFLFYHRQSAYICGSTPLVCWLFPFMITDILGLKVSPEYTPPMDYDEPEKYMNAFDEKQFTKKSIKRLSHSVDSSKSNASALDEMTTESIEELEANAVLEMD